MCSFVLKFRTVFTDLNLNLNELVANSSRGHFPPMISTKMTLLFITNVAPTCRVTSTGATIFAYESAKTRVNTYRRLDSLIFSFRSLHNIRRSSVVKLCDCASERTGRIFHRAGEGITFTITRNYTTMACAPRY